MVLPPFTCMVRCQDLRPFFTMMRCAPLASCKVVGVFPTNAPSTSISAAATEDVIETVAVAPEETVDGAAGAMLIGDVLLVGPAAGPTV